MRLHRTWDGSLRFRLLAFGLMPLLLAFPVVIAVMLLVGGQRADALIEAQLNSNLSSARNYLDVIKTDTRQRIRELTQSPRLNDLILNRDAQVDLNQTLGTAARGSGLDFLLVAAADGTVLGSSTGGNTDERLPDSHVIRQARIGVATAGYEKFNATQLAAFSPAFPGQARVESESYATDSTRRRSVVESDGLLINAAAHFPLSVTEQDAILVGGVLLNNNSALIEHMREIIFPVGALPDNVEGMTSIYLGNISVAASRQHHHGLRPTGLRVPAQPLVSSSGRASPWLGKQTLDGVQYLMGYAPILGGEDQYLGMVGIGVPASLYQRMTWLLLGMIAGLLGLSMLGISVVFLGVGQELTQRLAKMAKTITAVRQGDRSARVGKTQRNDEIGLLAQHFDRLLDTIAEQEIEQQAAQRTIAEEASRRRALFHHERDGVVILNADGTVFEVNPSCVAMLGYSPEAFKSLRLSDWDAHFVNVDLGTRLHSVGPDGEFFETMHRRRDGSHYAAEVSMSRTIWGGHTFVLMLMRDVSERKAVENFEKFHNRILQMLAGGKPLAEILPAILTGIEQLHPEIRCSISMLDAQGQQSGNCICPSAPGCDDTAPERIVRVQPIYASSQQILGNFSVSHRSTYITTEAEVALIEQTVQLVSIAIEKSRAEEQIRNLAFYDSLTALPNRRLLDDRLAMALADSRRSGAYGALMVLDLDNFKPLNDLHGHAAGDLLLIEVSRRLIASVREVDTVARIGGDEFVILLNGLTSEQFSSKGKAMAIAEKIRLALAQPYTLRAAMQGASDTLIEHHCASSIGVTLFLGKELKQNEILKNADFAMYRAKAAGRNAVRFMDPVSEITPSA